MATILRYIKSPTTRRVKIISDENEESRLEDDVQLNDSAFRNGRTGRNLNRLEDIHRLEKDFSDEEKALQDAPSWAKPMYREIKHQGTEVTWLKTQFTSFIVHQRLSEYEKLAQFIGDQYEEFNAEKEHMNRISM